MTQDEEAIRGVLAAYVEAWNRHDMDAWGALFTPDVDYVNRAGGWWPSNRENVAGHRAIHQVLRARHTPMTYASSVEKISFLTPDIALVHASWDWPGGAPPAAGKDVDFRGLLTMIMVKQGGRWLIRALQNTVADSTSPPPPG